MTNRESVTIVPRLGRDALQPLRAVVLRLGQVAAVGRQSEIPLDHQPFMITGSVDTMPRENEVKTEWGLRTLFLTSRHEPWVSTGSASNREKCRSYDPGTQQKPPSLSMVSRSS